MRRSCGADDADRDKDEADELQRCSNDLKGIPASAHGDETLGRGLFGDAAGAEIDRNIADDRDDERDAEADGREDKPCRWVIDRDDDAEDGCHCHSDGHDSPECSQQPLLKCQLVFVPQSADHRVDESCRAELCRTDESDDQDGCDFEDVHDFS